MKLFTFLFTCRTDIQSVSKSPHKKAETGLIRIKQFIDGRGLNIIDTACIRASNIMSGIIHAKIENVGCYLKICV